MAEPAPAAAPAAPAAPQQENLSVLGVALEAGKSAPAAPAPAKAEDKKTATSPTPAVAAGEIKLTPPKDSGLDDNDAKAIADFAKANGLTQAQAEKVMERDAGNRKAQTEAQKAEAAAAPAKQAELAKKVMAEGAKMFAADPDFGGQKLQASIQDATAAIAKFADPELQQFLAKHPLGSDPLVLRMFARIGANLREDSTSGNANGNPGSTAPTDTPSRWYGGKKPA